MVKTLCGRVLYVAEYSASCGPLGLSLTNYFPLATEFMEYGEYVGYCEWGTEAPSEKPMQGEEQSNRKTTAKARRGCCCSRMAI
jgi:hypothetical protein